MRKTIFLFVTLALMALVVGASARNDGGMIATAVMKDVKGNDIGRARFTEDNTGSVHIDVSVKSVSPGRHGIHIHETGRCDPTFAAAGAHYNPAGKKHGLSNPQGAHAGDLPDLTVNEAGDGRLSTTTHMVTLSPGKATLFDQDGSALVIHAGPDDQMTDPAGNSGDRIACGVIQKDGT